MFLEMCKLKLVLSICIYKSPSVYRRRSFPIGIIGYNCWWRVPMTTTSTPDDAAAAEHPKLIRTYRTRAYLSRAGHVRWTMCCRSSACSTTPLSRSAKRPGSNTRAHLFRRAEPISYGSTQRLPGHRRIAPQAHTRRHSQKTRQSVRGVPSPCPGGRGPRTSAFQVLQALEDSRDVFR